MDGLATPAVTKDIEFKIGNSSPVVADLDENSSENNFISEFDLSLEDMYAPLDIDNGKIIYTDNPMKNKVCVVTGSESHTAYGGTDSDCDNEINFSTPIINSSNNVVTSDIDDISEVNTPPEDISQC
jgi:hypothetical protein